MLSWKVPGHDDQLKLQASLAQELAKSDRQGSSARPRFMCGVCRQKLTLVELNRHLSEAWVIFRRDFHIWELIYFYHVAMGFEILANMISSYTQMRFILLCHVFCQKLIIICLQCDASQYSSFIFTYVSQNKFQSYVMYSFLVIVSQTLRFTYQIQILSLNRFCSSVRTGCFSEVGHL